MTNESPLADVHLSNSYRLVFFVITAEVHLQRSLPQWKTTWPDLYILLLGSISIGRVSCLDPTARGVLRHLEEYISIIRSVSLRCVWI